MGESKNGLMNHKEKNKIKDDLIQFRKVKIHSNDDKVLYTQRERE